MSTKSTVGDTEWAKNKAIVVMQVDAVFWKDFAPCNPILIISLLIRPAYGFN